MPRRKIIRINAAELKCWKKLSKELSNHLLFKEADRFKKNGYPFNGSQIDRSCSYSKIDFQLKQNIREQEQAFHQSQKPEHSQNQYSVLDNAVSAIGGLLDIQPLGTEYDPEEAEFQRQHKLKKKKRGMRL